MKTCHLSIPWHRSITIHAPILQGCTIELNPPHIIQSAFSHPLPKLRHHRPPPHRQRNPPPNQAQPSQRRHRSQKLPSLRIKHQQIYASTEHRHASCEEAHSNGVLRRGNRGKGQDGRVNELRFVNLMYARVVEGVLPGIALQCSSL